MWQPIARCIRNCPNCYIKRETEPVPVKNGVPKGIYHTEDIVPQQFTISLDTILPGGADDLVKTLKWVWNKQASVENPPELCITVADVDTMKIWAREMEMSPDQFLRPVSILSLSKFPILGKHCEDIVNLCKTTETTLNYNCKINKTVIESRQFELGLRYSNMTYLVMQKSPLGKLPDVAALRVWVEASKIESGKVILDRCAEWSTSGSNTCGACSKIIHIWPNNVVSGCPYDSNYLVALQEMGNLVERIRAIQKLGEKTFNKCKIKHILKSKP